MNSWTKTMAVISCLLTPNAFANVEVSLGDSIDIIASNGEEVGMRINPIHHLELDSGTNQIAIRVSKLIQKPDGQFEKYNSPVSILTFSADDQKIVVLPSQNIKNKEDADAFTKAPNYTLTTEGEITVTQDILPRGNGFTRDYEKEIARYNSKREIYFEKSVINTPFSSKKESKKVTVANSDTKKLKEDFLELSVQQQKEFLKWAVSQ